VLEYTTFSVRNILAVTALLQVAAGVVWFWLYSDAEKTYMLKRASSNSIE